MVFSDRLRLGDVPDNAGEASLLLLVELAYGQVHRERAAVFPLTHHLPADPNNLRLARLEVVGKVAVMLVRERFGHQHFDVLADKLFRLVAEDPLGGWIHCKNRAPLVDGNDPVHRAIHQAADMDLRLGQLVESLAKRLQDQAQIFFAASQILLVPM